MSIRLELSGTMAPPSEAPVPSPSNPPRIILTYGVATTDKTLHVKDLMDEGYTAFDVICIGGGGGQGGWLDAALPSGHQAPTYGLRAHGGAGGGGGIQRVKGLLADLADTEIITVASGGNPGTNDVSNPANTTDGSDGGSSTLAGTLCQASGGKGGKRATAVYEGSGSSFAGPGADGGDGGLGGTTVAGGGGNGGVAGVSSASPIPTNATPGSWDPTTGIGGGGGGGAGGIGEYAAQNTVALAQSLIKASSGAGGAFNAADASVYSPGGTASVEFKYADSTFGSRGGAQVLVVPGPAGGASASPINQLADTYGGSVVGKGTPGNPNTDGASYGTEPAIPADAQKGKDGAVVIAVSAK